MWSAEFILTGGGVITDLHLIPPGFSFIAPTTPIESPRALLVTIHGTRLHDELFRYRHAICYPIRFSDGLIEMDPTRPLRELLPAEQLHIARWLREHSWEAWCRSDQELRAFVGCDGEPVLLADAAERSGFKLGTLAKAARDGRLPTIPAADRQLIYQATIDEAIARRLLRAPKQATEGDADED